MFDNLRKTKNLSDFERFHLSYMTEPMSGCWLWIGSLKSTGYGQFTFQKKNGYSHRYSWKLHNGPIPNNLWVLHRCDTRSCVNPDHLFLGTHTDNMLDCVNKGRHKHFCANGQRHPMAILTDNQATKILADTRTHASIAAEYGVDRTTVSALKRGKNWKILRRDSSYV